ncbi:hypothetical protein BP6252_00139 [Coleophoma cylindrospora]|uniref:Uncharacterized protein n=1 Tax=Coleophoma cylindrospora TaxID=1849047 RepID=A0A3D8SP85_9HELO|nr:hypothetical protein BP6252_00139 [Coleophoma cylindrospora]
MSRHGNRAAENPSQKTVKLKSHHIRPRYPEEASLARADIQRTKDDPVSAITQKEINESINLTNQQLKDEPIGALNQKSNEPISVLAQKSNDEPTKASDHQKTNELANILDQQPKDEPAKDLD